MNAQIRGNSETGRLTVAALLAVVMHLSLAALPVNWRPILQQPTVLQVTLTAPPPTPTPPAPKPAAPIAAVTTTPVAVPPTEPAPPIKPEPPAPAIAVARPSTAPKLSKAPPLKREPKRELPKPPPVVAQSKPAPPPKPKPLKPTTPPPIITAKTPAKDQKPLAQPERPRRLASAKSVDSAEKDLEHSPDRNTTRFDRRAFDDDLDLPLASAKPARSMAKASGSDSGGGSATVAPVAASRPTPIEVGLRPLPGNPQPRYPAEARQRGIEGKVVLRLTVSAAGSVEAASVARSSGNDLLDQEARLTVLRWRFQPLAGPKVAQIPISFRLQN